jgi:hypothetical protein
MCASLKHLGIPPNDYRVLKLLPLIWVAWADGKMEGIESERIRNLATTAYDLSDEGVAVLERWLARVPDPKYFAEALHDLYLLAKAGDDYEVDLNELPGLVSYAEAIARSTATALDQPTAVSPAERAALEQIARELHVDHGMSWARLLEELREPTGARSPPRATIGRS